MKVSGSATNRPWVNPYLAVLVGVFAVSFSSLFVKLSSAPPLIIATYRLFLTFLIMAPYALACNWRGLKAMNRRQTYLSAASGIFLALHFVTWFTSLKYTSVASSVVLVTTQPVFVVIGSYVFFKERISRKAVIGGVLALFGSFIIGVADFQFGMSAFFGDMLALAAAVMVSGYLLIGRCVRGDVDLSAYTFVVYGSSSLVLILASSLAKLSFYPYPPREWLLFLALAVVCTILGHTVFSWVLRYVQASVVSVSVLGEPLGAIVWASLFLGEYPSARQTLGAVLIFSGLYLFTRVAVRQQCD
jgi:drug/metabolite transporter (DMT)-like permease